MPTVKDEITGDVVSRQPYTSEGAERAETIAESNPNWTIDYAPGGETDAMFRSEQTWEDGTVESPVEDVLEDVVEDETGVVEDNPVGNPYEEMTKGY